MSEGFITSLKKYTTKEQFDKETILEDLDLDVFNYDDFYDVVFENDNFKICHPNAPEGMIPLAAGTRWLAGSSAWNTDRKTGYDEIDTEQSYGPYAQYQDYYVILSKHDSKKKWMFKDGYGDIYVPSYARYPCATWVAENGDEAMWKWFLDQKFPYISTNLDKKVGHKMMKEKTVFVYPDDVSKLTFYNKQGSNITKVEFAPGVSTIKASSFSGLQNVKEIVVPEGVTKINSSAFYNCGVEKIVLPSTIKIIGNYAFSYCRGLKEINLPDSITKIGEHVFANDMALEKMPDWPKGVDVIPDGCFYYTAITKVVIPDHIKVIGRGAFDNDNIKTIIIPNSVESIGANAFEGKYAEYVYIPSSVKKMDSYAFGSLYSWDRQEINPNLVIDCESESKPEGWDNGWNVYDRQEKPEYRYNYHGDWNDPNRFEYKRYKVNWGVKSPRQTIKEELELDTAQIPGVLNDGQCDKLLDLLVSLPEMAENDQGHFLEICKDWLLNIWMSNNTPSSRKLEDYADTLSNPEIKHVIRYWAKDRVNNRNNYMISRFTEDGLGYILGGEYDPDTRVAKSSDICVSDKFLKEYLGFSDEELDNVQNPWDTDDFHEDLDLDVAEFPTDYDDEHWSVYHPRTQDEYQVMADGTTWFDDRYNDNDREDWHFTYYTNPPFYIFENKDTGEKFLYNTRENWSSLKDAQGNTWQSESGRRNLGYNRTAGNMLGLFLLEMPNTDGVARWAMRKWPQGLAILKSMIKANDILVKEGNVITYKSEVYNRIHEASQWSYNKEDKIYVELQKKVKQIRFPRNTHKIEENAFREWKGLESVVIPNTVTEIGEFAFSSCESLSSVKLSDRVISIGEYCFSGDKKLTGNLFIPASCTHIGRCAFNYCNFDTIYCEAPEKPEGWDENWNEKGDIYVYDDTGEEAVGWTRNRTTHRESRKHKVVWGSKGPVQEDLELDNVSTEIDIPDDKKQEAALLLGISPAEKRWGMRWWVDLEPYEETSRIVITPYKVHLGDKVYFITANLANRLLKQLNIDYEVSEPEFD